MFKKATNAEFTARIEELEQELEFTQKSNERKANSDFLDSLQAQAKITAEDKFRLERIFSVLSGVDAEFAAMEDPKVASFCADMKGFLKNLPARVEFSELATRKNAPKGTYSTPQQELGMKIAQSLKG